jgi:hypothetical protein
LSIDRIERPAFGDMRLLAIHAATNFVLSGDCMERESDPDGGPAPRLFFAGCAEGNLAHVRLDVSPSVARRVLDLLCQEPPWPDPLAPLASLDSVRELLASDGPVQTVDTGYIYALSRGAECQAGAAIVRSGSEEARALLVRLGAQGMPPALREAGFRSVGDFWEPWCAVLEGEEIASIAFAARLAGCGAEIGVYTFQPHRRRGHATAATAAWCSMPEFEGRTLFYSTSTTNAPSQRVAAGLGLRRFGATLRVD